MPQQATDTLDIFISKAQLITAINKMKKKQRSEFIEDLLAATSPEYLESIREAREDFKKGRVFSHEDVFGK